MSLSKVIIGEQYGFWMEEEADFVVRALQKGEVWETTALAFWAEACLNLRGSVLDVGAYTGIYSLLAATVSQQVVIEAFEPHLPVFLRLRDNVVANRLQERIKLHNLALSDQTGTGYLNITGSSELPSGSSLEAHPSKEKIASPLVFTRTGDDLFAEEDVKLVKIDAERHEYAILLGLKKTLVQCQPICFVEILEKKELDAIFCFMNSVGYNDVALICEDLKATVSDDRIYQPMKDRTNYIFKSVQK